MFQGIITKMFKYILLILTFATILVTVWFKDGNVLGTAEDSLPLYNISHFLPESQFAWMEHPGLGRVTINLTAARPTYELLTFLQRLGLPNFLIQALIFWFILVGSGLGIYFITKEFFPKLQDIYIFSSVLFYWFNPLSMVNVWNRFLLAYIFSFGLLPIISFIFIRGLRTKNYLWSLIFVLILPPFGFAFTYLAFDILLWIFLFTLTLLFFLTQEELDTKLFYIKYFFLTLLLFILTNIWWIGQVASLTLYKNISSSVLNFDVSANLGTLDALSRKLGSLSNIFRLVNSSFINENSLSWMRIFNSLPFVVMQYLITAIILRSIIRGRKNKFVLISGGLFFISIYLAKGTSPPFGEIYQFIFTYIPSLQVFRNPFEKAAFILSLSSSLLIGFSLFDLSQQIPKKFGNLLLFFFLGFILIIWGFPFYTGLVFTSPDSPTNKPDVGYQVKVPLYYQEADKWLSSKGSNFRYIGFPLGDEGITYNWEKGYSGVELSSALFSTPGVLHRTAVPYFTDLVPQIQEILLSQNDFSKLANSLNARFFFVRHDINFELRKMNNPTVIDNNLAIREKNNEIKKVATFGQLTFWENLRWQDRTFYPAVKIIKSSNGQQVSELLNVEVNKGEALLMDAKNTPVLNTETRVDISYKRINPAKYIVHIKNTQPFILVFSELFNDVWQASNQGNIYKHFRTNFYANGWLIDRTGDFDIAVEYLPQKLLEAGEKISIGSYLSIVLICTFLISKRIKGKLK